MSATTQLQSTLPGQSPRALIPDGRSAGARASLPPGGSDVEPDLRRKPEEPPAPQHPIPFMQDAFAESLVEATQGGATPKPKLRTGDAKARRMELLDREKSDPPPVATWRYRPGQVNHELRRLMAQISFGVYLLLNGMANSQVLVVSILQGHIDEVDEFLETTLEDIGLATTDLKDRTEHLKLPMENMSVFEQMLEDGKFRNQILDGNQKIEHIIARTQIALQQTVQDLAEGVSATREFSLYLAEQEHGAWRRDRPDMIDIFDAMKGNTDGWFNAFIDLQAKASELNGLIVRLNGMVAEMERKASEASRRIQFSVIEPFVTQPTHLGHTPRVSDASSSMTPPVSPLPKISSSPPRLSLRLSTVNPIQSMDSPFFDIQLPRASIIVTKPDPSLEKEVSALDIRDQKSKTMLHVGAVEAEAEEHQAMEKAQTFLTNVEEEPIVPRSPPARNPRRLSERPRPRVEEPANDDSSAGEKSVDEQLVDEHLVDEKQVDEPVVNETDTLYILQPRTYTPLPPSPLPSPRVKDTDPRRGYQPKRDEPNKPRLSVAVRVSTQIADAPLSPRFQQQLRTQPSKPKLVAISKSVRRPNPKPDARPEAAPEVVRPEPPPESQPLVPSVRRAETHPEPQRPPPPRPHEQPQPQPQTLPQPQQEPQPQTDLEVQPRQRTSLRQRVSLKTTPPESIQVPPPNGLAMHRPMYYQSPRACQAPDSAYGSDMERPPVNSVASINSSLAEFPAPPVRSILVPSPHSDQQFFRPVQASPYSPLQQRPHTSGTVGPPQYIPSRDIPSAMGMSMLSNVTTMTQESGSSRTLKKKRSAFGWLKKAFSLDEEERAAFEAKKSQQTRNPYYEDRTPKFLDGKRIQPRQTQTFHQGH